jgi:hypothetical protein
VRDIHTVKGLAQVRQFWTGLKLDFRKKVHFCPRSGNISYWDATEGCLSQPNYPFHGVAFARDDHKKKRF